MLRALRAFFPALLFTYLVASLLATQSVMQRLRELGVEISLQTQLQASWHDLLGMASSYLLLLLVTFAIALPVAAGLVRLFRAHRTVLFVLAGFTGVLALHLTLSAVLSITPIAAARTWPGLLGQCLAGAAGAWLYVRLSSGTGPR